jgi:signal transduction histidine kinase
METGAIVGLANHTVLLRRDGTELPIEDSAAPIRDGGRIFGIVLVFRDVSERRTYENQREQADRRRDEYLAMLAHELRNPLAVIGNGVALLRRLPLEGLPQPEIERLGKIGSMLDRHMQHLTRLVDDLLDVARITSGKIALQPSVQPLSAIVGQAVEMSRHVLLERSTKIEIVQASEPLTVNADSHRLAQAITNLLTNAAKFSAVGASIMLLIEATRDEVVLRVRDPGIGIEPQMLPRVFELFSQADQTLARTQGGLGIGLTVVKSLVELHGGCVEAHSEGLGRGSEFIVRLPRPGGHSRS